MKRVYYLLLMLLLGLPAWGQKEAQTKKILDEVSSRLSTDSGILTTFRLRSYKQGQLTGNWQGDLSMKGDHFILTTPGSTTWFDGKTQWTYVSANEEMNISNPTEEELRSLNPYSFIGLYKKGFNYKSSAVTFKGEKAYQITLMPEKKSDIAYIILWVSQSDYRLLLIQANASKEEYMLIEPLTYRNGQSLKESSFRPDLKQYNQAEIIDLR